MTEPRDPTRDPSKYRYLRSGPYAYACRRCGAYVEDVTVHEKWHRDVQIRNDHWRKL